MGQKLSKIKENFIFLVQNCPKHPQKNPKKRKSPPGKRFFRGQGIRGLVHQPECPQRNNLEWHIDYICTVQRYSNFQIMQENSWIFQHKSHSQHGMTSISPCESASRSFVSQVIIVRRRQGNALAIFVKPLISRVRVESSQRLQHT